MRLLLLLVPLALLTACTGASSGDDLDLKVGGEFGRKPTIVFPAGKPSAELQIDELSAGKGAKLAKDDVAIVQYTAHVWDGRENRLVDSSFNRGTPAAFPVGRLLPGLDKALQGRAVGSRVIASIPPAEGFGANPPQGIGPDDDLFYVVDILGAHARNAHASGAGTLAGVRVSGGERPRLSIPSGVAPPRAFAARVLERGDGPKTRAGQLLVTQHEGAVWAGGKVFDSTWKSGQPKAFTIGEGRVIKGWDRALVGVPTGSRVLMIVPPSSGYGATGHPQFGITGADTLVFVVDVLAAY
ncbi:FKBP-type peptidyl-prolyl cis-trans isomerase [Nonomuraea sp. NPDC003804]|uniref:FKBP-type peptidyl-prolyl cis-trans isomerase n=1 Tax=Nonomuraea sp. NPDC003804 TaxID=3154547 RepID=UPI0033AC5406